MAERADDRHDCPGGCGRRIHRARLACPQDWASLPAPLRGRINRAYTAKRLYPHDLDIVAAYRQAVGEALSIFRDRRRPR